MQLEWLSITLWSIETFFQVFKNMRRRSTYGLSTTMVLLTTCGKTTDFLSTYLLIIPLQYVIMCYFSSSVAFINTLQVIWYWNKVPASDYKPKSKVTSSDASLAVDQYGRICLKTSSTGNLIRGVSFVAICLMEICFVAGLIWRGASWLFLFGPLIIAVSIGGYYMLVSTDCYNRVKSKIAILN